MIAASRKRCPVQKAVWKCLEQGRDMPRIAKMSLGGVKKMSAQISKSGQGLHTVVFPLISLLSSSGKTIT
jgi:hypothetical protein